ncbi:unnamed protein product [Cyprideis torosa]|uniref:Uncharacterized protein n=1 Tax=Cyprideis torosa TaxID=163714 RepID=A0A7R8WBI5_9CRUS|nr:unnamed protein product [Cyprideis torosa]CAG0887405.1 unnamed protein product [Cyprideis torosa]
MDNSLLDLDSDWDESSGGLLTTDCEVLLKDALRGFTKSSPPSVSEVESTFWKDRPSSVAQLEMSLPSSADGENVDHHGQTDESTEETNESLLAEFEECFARVCQRDLAKSGFGNEEVSPRVSSSPATVPRSRVTVLKPSLRRPQPREREGPLNKKNSAVNITSIAQQGLTNTTVFSACKLLKPKALNPLGKSGPGAITLKMSKVKTFSLKQSSVLLQTEVDEMGLIQSVTAVALEAGGQSAAVTRSLPQMRAAAVDPRSSPMRQIPESFGRGSLESHSSSASSAAPSPLPDTSPSNGLSTSLEHFPEIQGKVLDAGSRSPSPLFAPNPIPVPQQQAPSINQSLNSPRTVLVSNIARTAKKEDIVRRFAVFGAIQDARIYQNLVDGSPFALVTFYSSYSASKASDAHSRLPRNKPNQPILLTGPSYPRKIVGIQGRKLKTSSPIRPLRVPLIKTAVQTTSVKRDEGFTALVKELLAQGGQDALKLIRN